MVEPAAKKPRLTQKTQNERNAEANARHLLQRLPPVNEPKTRDEYIKWIRKHYTRTPLANDAQQRLHWDAQTCQPNTRTFCHEDGTPTPRYNSLQNGVTRATRLTEQEEKSAKLAVSEKISATQMNLKLGQLNWLESAAIKAFVTCLESRGYSVGLERMPDCVIVDLCATYGSFTAPVQVKSARGLPGASVNLNVNKHDGSTGGRYEDHILICLIVSAVEDDCKQFDDLQDVDIMELYIMKSSAIKAGFGPVVYDHTPGSKRGRKNAYENFRYVFGRDGPDKFDALMGSFESNIKEIYTKRGWTREHCFFTFGAGSPNTTIGPSKQIELLGMKAVHDALIPFQPRAPLRQGETVDIMFTQSEDTNCLVRVSLKTAEYHHLNQQTKAYSGFQFKLMKAPNSDYCDIVIAVQFNVQNRRQAVSAYVFDAKDVYNINHKAFCWNKSAHQDKKFDLTNESGCFAFKERVSSFMKSDEERSAPIK
jgi:hypothetical protein